jgi:hypothetical protein
MCVEEVALERVSRQTRRSHVVAPPPTPTWEEDRICLGQWVTSKYIFDLFHFFILYMMLTFFRVVF